MSFNNEDIEVDFINACHVEHCECTTAGHWYKNFTGIFGQIKNQVIYVI